METQIATVDFHGQTLLAIQNDNEIRVAIKPICENIGLKWHGQFERISRNQVLKEGIRITRIPSAGGEQETVTLPLEMLNGWLFGVDANRAMLAYQHFWSYNPPAAETTAVRVWRPGIQGAQTAPKVRFFTCAAWHSCFRASRVGRPYGLPALGLVRQPHMVSPPTFGDV